MLRTRKGWAKRGNDLKVWFSEEEWWPVLLVERDPAAEDWGNAAEVPVQLLADWEVAVAALDRAESAIRERVDPGSWLGNRLPPEVGIQG